MSLTQPKGAHGCDIRVVAYDGAALGPSVAAKKQPSSSYCNHIAFSQPGGVEVVVLPLLYEECEPPEFRKSKLDVDFSKAENYEAVLGKLLRQLRIA